MLKKPVSRAEYLLSRAGVTIGANERLDPAFLMEILELREDLAAARHAGRTDVVAANQAMMVTRRRAVLAELPALFRADDLPALKERLIVLRYLDRYLEECNAALDDAFACAVLGKKVSVVRLRNWQLRQLMRSCLITGGRHSR
jgi:DnaJ-domain-containing protein 1